MEKLGRKFICKRSCHLENDFVNRISKLDFIKAKEKNHKINTNSMVLILWFYVSLNPVGFNKLCKFGNILLLE